MNVELVNPMSLLASLSATRAEGNGSVSSSKNQIWRNLGGRLREELRYLQARIELSRLDDRDLDDLALGRGDLPGLARRHAQATVRR